METPAAEPIRVRVPLAAAPYDALVGDGLLAQAGRFCAEAGLSGRCAVIADDAVFRLHGEALVESLRGAGFGAEPLLFPSGERSKSMAQAADLLERMARLRLDRGSFVVALGGGVAGDLGGFVAAVFLRGVPYVQAPTTVVAQVDSSVGGKTGVNLEAGKNLAGAFHQPRLVIADTATLETLPEREFNQGLAEIIKHAAIRDPELLARMEGFSRGQPMGAVIARNIEIKAAVVAADERETTGLRALLNFGHTLGHAIENAAGYGRYFHGEAVALGMTAAARISARKAGLPPADAERLIAALKRFGLPERLDAGISPEAVVAAAGSDKKFAAGQVRFVVLDAIGSARLSSDVTRADLLEAVRELQR